MKAKAGWKVRRRLQKEKSEEGIKIRVQHDEEKHNSG